MASIPCPTRSDRPGCVCDDNPLANLSTEPSDGRIWYGHVSVPPIYEPPAGNLTEPSVPVFCISNESQVAADECANNGTVPPTTTPPQPQPPTDPNQPPDTPPTTTGDPNPTNPTFPTTPEPTTGFWNTESNCIALCADHSNSATAIIPAHTINGSTQAEADMLSSNACIAIARANLVCFTPPTEGTVVHLCEGVSKSITCVVAGGTLISITGLPTGMSSLCDSNGICTISGTPSACGNYTVTVSAASIAGIPVSFNFTMMVLGFSCPNSGEMGQPYFYQFTGCGGTGPYTFSSGSDIATYGLSMTSSGLITGTPTGICNGSIPFSVTVTDADGNTCTKDCPITIGNELCSCPDWGTAQPTGGGGSGSGDYSLYSYTDIGCGYPGQVSGNPPPANGSASMEANLSTPGTAGACKCRMDLDCTITPNGGCTPSGCLDEHIKYSLILYNVRTTLNPATHNETWSGVTADITNFVFWPMAGFKWYLAVQAGPADFDVGPGPYTCCGGHIRAAMTFQTVDTTPAP